MCAAVRVHEHATKEIGPAALRVWGQIKLDGQPGWNGDAEGEALKQRHRAQGQAGPGLGGKHARSRERLGVNLPALIQPLKHAGQ